MNKKLHILIIFFALNIPGFLFAQYIQQGPKLVGTGTIGNSQQGRQVAISSDGNTVIIGGAFDNTLTGAVWIFVRNTGVWTQQGSKLTGTGGQASYFGSSVSLSSDGNTALIGASGENNHIGAVYVFIRNAGVWTQQGPKLTGTGNTGNSNQGSSVSLSADGNTALIGGPNDNNLTGATWVFVRSGGVWSQQGSKLVGSGYVGYSDQGYSLSLSGDGNTAVVGGQLDNNSMGAVWVFNRTGGSWSQVGSKLVGTGNAGGADQGFSVAISADGNTFVSGGASDANSLGATWVFTKNAGVWTQQGPKLYGTGGLGPNPEQGYSVSISSDGNTIITGGPDDSTGRGAVWVFTRSNGLWSQSGPKLTGSGSIGVSFQGTSVSISSDGGTFVSGGHYDNNQAGGSWVFFNPTIGITRISNTVPENYRLIQNYPNPFNPSTKIKFSIPSVGSRHALNTTLKIYDISGREVETLVNENLKPGTYEVDWNATKYSSGVYFYKLVVGDNTNSGGKLVASDFIETKKMVLVK